MIVNDDLFKLATEVANNAHDTINSDEVNDVIIVLCLAAVMLAKIHDIADDTIRELIDEILTNTVVAPGPQ